MISMFTNLCSCLFFMSAGAVASILALESQQIVPRLAWYFLGCVMGILGLFSLPASSHLEASTYPCFAILVYALRITYLLFVERLHVQQPHPGADAFSRPKWMIKTVASVIDSRDTKDRSSCAIHPSTTTKADSPPSKTRLAFLRTKIATILLIYLARRAASHYFPTPTIRPASPWTPTFTDIAPRAKRLLLRRLPHVSRREIAIRAGLVLLHNGSNWSALTLAHSALAVLCVGVLRIHDPHQWSSPFFGSPLEAYTLRRYWSRFWHRAPVRTLRDYALLLGEKVLGLRKGSVAYRLWTAFFVFAASGAIHGVAHVVLGFWCGWWEEMRWWTLNFLAVVVEDVVCAVWKGVMRKRGSPDKHRWELTAMGYAWVFAFQFWSLPKLYFPKVFCLPG